jgi:hypothetical protein
MKSLAFTIPLLLTLGTFATANVYSCRKIPICDDCFWTCGVPLRLYRLGGWAHVDGVLWVGVTADILVALAIGALIGWLNKRLLARLQTK